MLIKNEYKPKMLPKRLKGKRPVSGNDRMVFVVSTLAAAFLALVVQGVRLQLSEKIDEERDNRVVRSLKLPATRGTITDRNGAVLALNVPAQSVYVDSLGMQTMPTGEQLAALSELVDVPQDKLEQIFSKQLQRSQKGSFVYIKRQLPKEVADKVMRLGIKGLHLTEERKRHYPMGNLFAHVVGFTDIDGKGLEGLERTLETRLRSQDGVRTVLRDNKNHYIAAVESPNDRNPVDGENIQLALDQRIQVLARDELNKAMEYHQAKAGSVVVLDARTGEILALVNNPTYDANQPGSVGSEFRRDRAVTDMIEPGSAMKPFAIAKALDDGKIRPNTWFNTNAYRIGPATVRDTHNYPSLDVRGIVQKSSNVGTSKIAAMYQPKELYDFYHKVGVGVRMHSGLPGESAGLLRDWKNWRPIEQATMSFGYGLQVSLLQLARAYTVLTADGKLMPVSVEKLKGKPQGEQVIKPETARTMRQIMVAVTEKGGTGTAGAVDGFDVGAKTGTARKLVNGHYVNDKHVATFIGFAPAANPRLIVAVTIDEPTQNGYYGGTVSGPVFKNIMAGGLSILGVMPTKPLKEKDDAQIARN